METHCTCFASPQELINHLAKQSDIDVLLLDITLGDEVKDGMSLAKHIRKSGNCIPIIFVTVDSLRATDGYLVEAMGFLPKPIDENRLTLFLDKIIKQKAGKKIIRIATENQMAYIYHSDIVYADIIDHKVTYHTLQSSISLRGTLGEVLAILDDDKFVQIHRSYVIALDKIDSIKTTYPYSVNLLMKGKIISLPVSRNYIKYLMEMYTDDIFERLI